MQFAFSSHLKSKSKLTRFIIVSAFALPWVPRNTLIMSIALLSAPPILPASRDVFSRIEDPDNEKTVAIQSLLRETTRYGLRGVQVYVQEKTVTLNGTVESYFLKQLAQETVRPLVFGIKIQNQLHVLVSKTGEASINGSS